MIPQPCVVVALSLLLAAPLAAQLARPGQPLAARQPQIARDELPPVVLPQPDVERMLAEDEANPSGALRYGAVIPVAYGCDDSGRWDVLPSGELVWRLRLLSPGARSLGILLGEYELPAGGELYVRGAEDSAVLGAFTSETRQPNGMLAVQPVPGEEIYIEYIQPAGVDERPRLVVTEVVHDYRGILEDLRLRTPQRIAAGCLYDVNCPEGDEYQDVKRSVIMVIAGGVQCSAGLINNVNNDGQPFFLTADHCGNMTNVVAYFGYEKTGCGTGGASTSKTISGATLLATSGFSLDLALHRLSSTPPASFEPFYAGWDRGTESGPAPCVSISHPAGLPKKIARDDEVPVAVFLFSELSTRWQVIWDLGALRGGSSGSPLFNGQKRILGSFSQVAGDTVWGCNDQVAFYGHFGNFWTGRNLGRWLDPSGTGKMRIDGHDPYRAQAIPYNGGGTNPSVYESTNLPALGTTWTASIDASGSPGAGSTWIIGHTAPSAGTILSSGELLVDRFTPCVFLSVAPVSGGVSLHSNAIPNDPLLAGQVAFTQGILFRGGGSRTLTNGIELRLR